MSAPGNIHDSELSDLADGVWGARLLEREPETRLVSAVWELEPGATAGPYHVHHATEELLVVVSGEPTLRTPDGERSLRPGDVVHFASGAAGAHQLLNRSPERVRYLMAAAHSGLDVIEYVDERQIVVYSRRDSILADETLFFTHDLPAQT